MPSRVLLRCLTIAIASLATLAPSALAASGGAALPGPPVVTGAACDGISGWTCPTGSQLTLQGEGLVAVDIVIFTGRAGRGDDRRAGRVHAGVLELSLRVPAGAKSGPLRLHDATTDEWVKTPPLQLAAPASDVSQGARLFAGSRQPVRFAYRAAGSSSDVVEVVNVDTGGVARSWSAAPSADGTGEIRWNGMVDGRPVATGRYSFRLAGQTQGASAATATGASFVVYDYLFPIRGRHDLGQSATNGFGGGRAHQGQDMFARCGTPLASVTSGRVRFAGSQWRAGNYVVIDGADGRSYVYMHMRDAPIVRTGQRVFTGQQVGVVGETGRASGCHLHFELWSSPGWYEGGTPSDPLPLLMRWDAYS